MDPSFVGGGALLLSYLLGSIPVALLAGKLKGIDIRKEGSGNLGAPNAIRVLGKPIGITVFLLDFAKGLFPPLAVRALLGEQYSPTTLELLAFASGVAAVLGHIFPVYLNFKGGKGVAATAGMLLAVRWDAALCAFGVFFAVRKITRYVSLSSMALAVVFPLAVIFLPGKRALGDYQWVILGSSLLALLILFKHRGNVARILNGTEPKIGRHPAGG